MAAAMSGLFGLPVDVLSRAGLFLDDDDVLSLVSCSRVVYAILGNSDIFWNERKNAIFPCLPPRLVQHFGSIESGSRSFRPFNPRQLYFFLVQKFPRGVLLPAGLCCLFDVDLVEHPHYPPSMPDVISAEESREPEEPEERQVYSIANIDGSLMDDNDDDEYLDFYDEEDDVDADFEMDFAVDRLLAHMEDFCDCLLYDHGYVCCSHVEASRSKVAEWERKNSVAAKNALLWKSLREHDLDADFSVSDDNLLLQASSAFPCPKDHILNSLPLNPLSYFEVTILHQVKSITIGICSASSGLPDVNPASGVSSLGSFPKSMGWSGADGFFTMHPGGWNDATRDLFGGGFRSGDVVGCGVDWRKRALFYCLNGVFCGYATSYGTIDIQEHRWVAAVSLGRSLFDEDSEAGSRTDAVSINFGLKSAFVFDLLKYDDIGKLSSVVPAVSHGL